MDTEKKKLIRFITLVIIDLLAFIGAVISYNIAKQKYWFLVMEGDPLKKALTWSVVGGCLFVILIINIRILLSIRVLNKMNMDARNEELKEKYMQEHSLDHYTLEDYRKLFLDVKAKKPRLSELLDEALNQIDIFYEDKEALDKVMKVKKLDYQIINQSVEQSERLMIENMRSFIPELIIWNPRHLSNVERQDSYQRLHDSIEGKLLRNKENQNTFHELIMSVHKINDSGARKDLELKSLIEALNYKFNSN